MQSQTARPESDQAARTEERRTDGQPVPLDPKQLQLVSGGLPKGTWGTTTTEDPFLPKGTW